MTVSEDFTSVTGPFRGELRAHCYLMLGTTATAVHSGLRFPWPR